MRVPVSWIYYGQCAQASRVQHVSRESDPCCRTPGDCLRMIAGIANASAEVPAAPGRGTTTEPIRLAADATGSPELPRSNDTAPLADSDDPPRVPLWTKYAYLVPARFTDLPGWRDDNLAEAWKAFRATCNVLGSRMAWAGSCARAASVKGGQSDDVRRFLEREFLLYQIHNRDRSPTGVITGYYEPLLLGSRRQGDRYRHPIYAVPDDLLFLDSRNLVRTAPGSTAYARVEGRTVIPVCIGTPEGAACQGGYRLDRERTDDHFARSCARIEGDRIRALCHPRADRGGRIAFGTSAVWPSMIPPHSIRCRWQGRGRSACGWRERLRLAFCRTKWPSFLPPPLRRRSARAVDQLLTRIDFPPSVGELDSDDSTAPPATARRAPAPRNARGKSAGRWWMPSKPLTKSP